MYFQRRNLYIMKYIKNLFLFTTLILMVSCNCLTQTTKKNNIDYEKEGYMLGIIEPKDSGNCGWIITNDKNKLFDPINIEDEKFCGFSKKKQQVYFKFLPLKRSNRCNNATPIKLIEMILYK